MSFSEDIAGGEFTDRVFLRVSAVGKKFERVNFKYCIFDTCYLRDCRFDSCDFTGCRFVGTMLHGSHFSGCKFDYALFERTFIDSEVLDNSCPPFENLKQRFARTLRMNYQQIGDAIAANKAISVELQATETHLYKAWKSNEAYYRKKYVGWNRLEMLIKWVNFRLLDLIWGNGESVLKIVRTTATALVLILLLDRFVFLTPNASPSFWSAAATAPLVFLGTKVPQHYPDTYVAGVAFVRLVILGFFVSILVRRFNRR